MSFRTSLLRVAIRTAAVAVVALTLTPQTADAQLFFGRGIFGGPGLLPRLGLMPPVYGPGYGYRGAGYGNYGTCGAYASTAYAGSGFQTASFGDACGCGVSTASIAPVSTVAVSNPCQVTCAPVAQVQAVPQTVYRDVQVTKYRPVQKSYRKPVLKTAYEERDVTVYKTVNEQKTVDVPYTTYQTVASCQTAQVDRSRWQTTYIPKQRTTPCAYDSRPGLLGWMNRTGYEMRQAFTPNYIARRQYVPNVQTVSYPVTRQVPITATRQVTYNVAKVVPVTEKRRVAVLKQDFENATYTAYEPYTETQTVAVGTEMRYAYVGGAGGTATASAPTPATATANRPVRPRTANGNNGSQQSAGGNPFGQLQSYEPTESQQQPSAYDLQVRGGKNHSEQVRRQRELAQNSWTSRNAAKSSLEVAGWRSATPSQVPAPNLAVATAD